MFDINLLKNEKIVLVDNDSLLKSNNDIINVTTIITNYRLLILDYPKGLNALKFGRMINYPQEKEVIFETELKNIVNINKVKEFYTEEEAKQFTRKDFDKNPALWKAIQDFGWDNFEHKILYTDLSA